MRACVHAHTRIKHSTSHAPLTYHTHIHLLCILHIHTDAQHITQTAMHTRVRAQKPRADECTSIAHTCTWTDTRARAVPNMHPVVLVSGHTTFSLHFTLVHVDMGAPRLMRHRQGLSDPRGHDAIHMHPEGGYATPTTCALAPLYSAYPPPLPGGLLLPLCTHTGGEYTHVHTSTEF